MIVALLNDILLIMTPTPQKNVLLMCYRREISCNAVKCKMLKTSVFMRVLALRETSHNSRQENSSLVIPTTGDGFSTVSFLLPFYAKMLKNGLNTELLSTDTIKLRKLEAKKLTRHKQSHKQSF